MTRQRRTPQTRRAAFDAWHATVVRYAGIGLLVYAVTYDQFRNPALLPAATGMIFYKNIAGGR